MKTKTSLKKCSLSLAVLFITVFSVCDLNAQIIDSSLTQQIKVKTFRSAVLGETRKIFIQTPANMKPEDEYPVLFLLDGGSFIELAGGQVRYLSESYKIIPSMIIVGINSNDRFKDMTPTHTLATPDGKTDSSINSPLKNSGGAGKFLQFMKEELIPYIEGNYPAAPYRILMGHSLGGLFGVYAMLEHPEVFNSYIAISPSLQWDNASLLNSVAQSRQQTKKHMLFFSDANEGTEFHKHQLRFDSLLSAKANKLSVSKLYQYYPAETHISVPVKAMYDGLRFIYPDWHLPYSTSSFRKIMTGDTVILHYQMLSDRYGYKVKAPQDDINSIAKFLAKDPSKISGAVKLVEMNMANYSRSVTVHEVAAEVFLKASLKEKATAALQRALAIDPANKVITEKLNIIK